MQKITHDNFNSYLDSDPDKSLAGVISELRNQSILYDAIFSLIDRTDCTMIAHDGILLKKSELQFPSIELMLEHIISGTISENGIYRFLKLMYHSANFFERVMTKVDQINAIQFEHLAAENNGVKIKSDHEIIYLIKNEMNPVYNSANRLENADTDLPVKPDNVIMMPVVRKFIIAAAAVLILVPVVYFITSQYKTTYKNNEARAILKENYRIYMKNQPRISGGYQSTGISQLMSGEEDSLDYLNIARELVDEVLIYKSRQKQALHLEAQILIMQQKYQAADSVLNIALNQDFKSPEMLNDLGVVYFAKKEWKKAETFFKLSVKQDSNYPEAYYNLALTEINLGHIQEARETVKYYLGIETDPGWKNAGLNLLSTMEGE